MRIYKIIENTKTEGPGNRIALWVQGCSIKCDDCFIKESWDFDKGQDYSLDVLKQYINHKNVDGITVLGGEPFDQLDALFQILRYSRLINKNTIVFSGYTYEELKKKTKGEYEGIFDFIDVLIDGRYDCNKRDCTRYLIGSLNQSMIPFSEKGKNIIEFFISSKNQVEVRVKTNGSILINGKW